MKITSKHDSIFLINEHYKFDYPVVVITNKLIGNLYLRKFGLEKNLVFYLNDGEIYKNLNSVNLIINFLLKNNCDKNTKLVALGGGVISDIVGFVAACYMRGISWISIPTSLMAQVDASIGGKTAVNTDYGKNLIGFFHHPKLVLINTDVLLTLPDREFYSGVAEIVKYSCILDKDFFAWLEKNYMSIKNNLELIVTKSIQYKLKVVEQDVFDKGIRRILNFGHTFAHAIEAETNYKKYLHGEAVSIGMCLASKLSNKLGFLKKDKFDRVVNLLTNLGLPVSAPTNKLLYYMKRDKKNEQNKITLILLSDLGVAKVYQLKYLELLEVMDGQGSYS